MTIEDGPRVRRSRCGRRRRRCGSTAAASASTASTSRSSTTLEGRQHHRRGVHRLGLDVLVQRDRPRHSGRQRRRARFAQLPCPGVAEFTADGSGTFDSSAQQLQVPRRPISPSATNRRRGDRHARAARQRAERRPRRAASPRLALTGAGRIALTPQADCELSFRFHDSSLDPYIRLFLPNLSARTPPAVDSGSMRDGRRAGRPRSPGGGRDGRLARHEAVRLRAEQRGADSPHARPIACITVAGPPAGRREHGSCVSWAGRPCATSRFRLQATGERTSASCRASSATCADPDAASCARASTARCRIRSSRAAPSSPTAAFAICRCRTRSTPSTARSASTHAGIQLDEVTASMGGGPIQFGGRINLDGYLPGELNVLITGQDMHLRYPEGIQSIVDVDLTLRGNMKAPVIGGTVSVQSAVWTRRLDAPGSIFDLAARTSSSGEGGATSGDMAAPVPIRFDLEIKAPSAFRMDTNLMQLTASADLTLQGTYDKPILLGRAEVDRGVANFEGRRYRVTRGIARLQQPGAHRAVHRCRGRNERARSRADVPSRRQRDGHAEPARPADARIRSPAAASRGGRAAPERRAARVRCRRSGARAACDCRIRIAPKPTSCGPAPRRR